MKTMRTMVWVSVVLGAVLLASSAFGATIRGDRRHVAGVIESLNGTPPNSFVLREPGRANEVQTVYVNPQTRFLRAPHREWSSESALKPGEQVRAWFRNEGGRDVAYKVETLKPGCMCGRPGYQRIVAFNGYQWEPNRGPNATWVW